MIIKKKYLKKALLELGCILLALLALVYLIYHSVYGYTKGVESAAAIYASEQLSLELEGVIFRDESVVYSGGTDRAIYCSGDGEKLSIGERAAVICSGVPSVETLTRLDLLDHRIRLIEKALDQPTSVTNYEILDAEIVSLLGSSHFPSGEGHYAAAERDSLSVNMIRSAMKDSKSETLAALDAMKGERDTLISSLGHTEDLTFERPLFFYRQCDGGEALFTLDALDGLTSDSLDALVSQYNASAAPQGVIGKTVYEHSWYLVLPISEGDAAHLAEGRSYNIEFSASSLTLKGELTRLDHTGEERLAILRFTGMPLGFDYTRIQNVKLHYGSIEGLRVPSSAMRYIDGRTCVYTVYGGQIFLRTADIVARSGEWCYISPSSAQLELEDESVIVGLKQNDFVVTRARDLHHLKIVE